MTLPQATPSLSEQLRDVVVSPRRDLSVSRHVFRSGPSYVLRDSVTFKTHRLDPQDFRILSALDQAVTLGDTFQSLVEQGQLEREDEEAFYGFIVDLHQRNLLSLPLSDGAVLYTRHERRQRAERMSRLLGVFFLRIPLCNPDSLLTRTVSLVRWLFTPAAFYAWIALVLVSLVLAIARWDELTSPVLTMFSGSNLLTLWAVLIGLKVVHEFGHAYACKAFGGHVPEMGVFLVLLTPLAYVDATDSWSFPKVRQRVAVSLAGMYFESIVGALALFTWAMTEPSTLNTIAYQTLLLATVTTVLFNMNPLLRYDAYYIVADLLGIPNLRSRCEAAVATTCKRLFFGVRELAADGRSTPHPGLVGFGLAQLGYRVVIMTTIATILVLKFGGIGIALASFVILLPLGKAALSLVRYILDSEQLAGRRIRAGAVTAGVTLATVLAFLFVPLPWPVHARGVSTFERVETIHAPAPSTIAWAPTRLGEQADAGQLLLRLESKQIESSVLEAQANYRHAGAEATRALSVGPAEASASQSLRTARETALAETQRTNDGLEIFASEPSHLLSIAHRSTGARVNTGDALLTIGSGHREVAFVLPSAAVDRLRVAIGDTISMRAPSQPTHEFTAVITHVGPTGSRTLEAIQTQLASTLKIPVDPSTGQATESYIEIRAQLRGAHLPPPNATVLARLPSRPMTTASMLDRRFALFLNKVNQGFSSR